MTKLFFFLLLLLLLRDEEEEEEEEEEEGGDSEVEEEAEAATARGVGRGRERFAPTIGLCRRTSITGCLVAPSLRTHLRSRSAPASGLDDEALADGSIEEAGESGEKRARMRASLSEN